MAPTKDSGNPWKWVAFAAIVTAPIWVPALFGQQPKECLCSLDPAQCTCHY